MCGQDECIHSVDFDIEYSKHDGKVDVHVHQVNVNRSTVPKI